MSDLISRQAAIDALEKVASFFPYKIPGKGETYDKYNEAWNDAIGRAEMEIESLQSAQPERPKGHWIHVGDGYTDYFRCSECGNLSDYEENFCCECGSDNRGEQDAEIR